MLPDKLQHQQLVEVRVQQRADDRVEFPIMVMGAFGEVDDHQSGAILPNSLEDKSRKCLLQTPAIGESWAQASRSRLPTSSTASVAAIKRGWLGKFAHIESVLRTSNSRGIEP